MDGVSKLSNWLFGIATQEEIDRVDKAISTLYSSNKAITHSVNGLVTVVNKTVEAINQQNRRFNDYTKYLQMLRKTGFELQKENAKRKEAINILKIGNTVNRFLIGLEAMYRFWLRNCQLFFSQQRALERGWLTLDLLKAKELENILHEQQVRFSTRALPVEWYYMNVRVKLLMWKGWEFVYQTELPTVNQDVFVLYSIMTIPVHTGVNDVWREVINLPDKVGWDSRRGGTIDVSTCYGVNPTVCPPMVHNRQGRCLTGVLTASRSDLKHCAIKLFNDMRNDMAIKIGTNTYLMSSRNNTFVKLLCTGKPESKALIDRVKIYTLDEGCIMESESWRVVGEYTGSFSLDYRYKQQLHIAKLITLDFHLEKMTDVKKIKKLVLHQPVLVKAGALQALYVKPATLPRKTLVVGTSVTSGITIMILIMLVLFVCCRSKCWGVNTCPLGPARRSFPQSHLAMSSVTVSNDLTMTPGPDRRHHPVFLQQNRASYLTPVATPPPSMMGRSHSMREPRPRFPRTLNPTRNLPDPPVSPPASDWDLSAEEMDGYPGSNT